MTLNDALRGPWTAYLLDEDGYAYTDPEVARAESDEEDEFQVVITRRSANPAPFYDELKMPGSNDPADLIWICRDEVTLDGDLGEPGATVMFERAQAMAAGLNAAGTSNTPGGTA